MRRSAARELVMKEPLRAGHCFRCESATLQPLLMPAKAGFRYRRFAYCCVYCTSCAAAQQALRQAMYNKNNFFKPLPMLCNLFFALQLKYVQIKS